MQGKFGRRWSLFGEGSLRDDSCVLVFVRGNRSGSKFGHKPNFAAIDFASNGIALTTYFR
jgi:hypothetical protein